MLGMRTVVILRSEVPRLHLWPRLVITAAILVSVGACSPTKTVRDTASSTGKLRVVAAENFWGSLAAQIGGDRVEVTSIISSPDIDPHEYEAASGDGRSIASAAYVLANGVGYDPWVAKLAAANPNKDRRLLDIGRLVGAKDGDNPHRWYFPDDVERVIDRVTSDYKALAPKDAAYFDAQRTKLEREGLKRYKDDIAEIRRRYAGTPVGASESIFVGLAAATGLDLRTPASFLTAISQGGDPTAADKATVDAQITAGEMKVFVYNSQNSTPDVQNLVKAARTAGIGVATVTETMTPATASFQEWQARQLDELAAALARATGH